MDSETFVDKCIRVCSMDKNSILKEILCKNLEKICGGETENEDETEIPSGIDIISYNPTQSSFPDFAISLCRLEFSKEQATRHILGEEFDHIMTRTRKRNLETQPEAKRARSNRINRRNLKLPGIMSVFTKKTRSGFEAMDNIEEIMKLYFWTESKYFSDCCIYADKSRKSYVIIVSESSVWKSHGVKNKLYWSMVGEKDETLFDDIVDDSTSVYIIRKRNGEVRYMGKCESVEEIDGSNSKCVMCVA